MHTTNFFVNTNKQNQLAIYNSCKRKNDRGKHKHTIHRKHCTPSMHQRTFSLALNYTKQSIPMDNATKVFSRQKKNTKERNE